MGLATIALEDDGSGNIACKLTFQGGYDPTSHAHQHARLVIAEMDKLCVQVEPMAPDEENPGTEPGRQIRLIDD
jgi:hypothetical protein